MSPGKSDGILNWIFSRGSSPVLFPFFSLSLSLSFSSLEKRVESASHILENCWGHLTSWQNMFPRIGGTWIRATLSGSVSISLSRRLRPSRVPFTAASFYRPLCLRFVIFFFFFFSPRVLSPFLNCPFCRDNNPIVRFHIRERDTDGYCVARINVDLMKIFFSASSPCAGGEFCAF